MDLLGNIKDSFKDMSLKGQAKNPLQILFNPLAVGTVGIAQLKDQDNKTGWFSNLFKGFGKSSTSKPISAQSGVTVPETNNNKIFYIVFGVLLLLIIIAVLKHKKTAP